MGSIKIIDRKWTRYHIVQYANETVQFKKLYYFKRSLRSNIMKDILYMLPDLLLVQRGLLCAMTDFAWALEDLLRALADLPCCNFPTCPFLDTASDIIYLQ